MTEASSSAPLQALLDLADRLDADGVGGVPEAWASVKLGLLAIGLPVVAGPRRHGGASHAGHP
ncbi:MAG: hypothetical protein R2690_13490 [Acidimicrobiales bacterium]